MNKALTFLLGSVLAASAQIKSVPFMAQAQDPDAINYFNRVEATGAHISPKQRAAVNTFVVRLKTTDTWPHLLDVGVFGGTALTSSVVKLKWPSGISNQLGFVAGTWAASNYSETIGIVGVPGKSLGTFINMNTVGTNGGIMFFLNADYTNYVSTEYWMGGIVTAWSYISKAAMVTAGAWGGSSGVASLVTPGVAPGLYHMYRATNTVQIFTINGVPFSTNTAAVTPSATSQPIGLGFSNRFAFYAIDDGQMTAAQEYDCALAVQDLVRGMGRRAISNRRQNFVGIVGQSLAGGFGSTATTIGQTNDNRMQTRGLDNGLTRKLANFPLLREVTLETISSGFCNAISSRSGLDGLGQTNDVTISLNNLSGAAYSAIKQGTTTYNDLLTNVVASKFYSPDYYTSFNVPGILCVHGESDGASTTYSNAVVEWQANLQTDIQAITGQTNPIPMFISQISGFTSTAFGVNGTTNLSNRGMLDAYESNPTNIVLVCPKYFLTYNSDGVHLTNDGYRQLGGYYAKAWYQRVVQGVNWQPLYPTNISRSGADIDLTFPTTNSLQLDVTLVSTNANWGFEYADSTASATISSVSWVAPGAGPTNTVRVTLSGTPSGSNKRIRYAHTGTLSNPGGPTTGVRGNLKRPETAWTSIYGYNLDDWCVHFDKVCP